jgi:hypothetical protein
MQLRIPALRLAAMLVLLPITGVNAACACGAGQSAAPAAEPAPVIPAKTENLPVNGQLLAAADAIVAEGVPLKPDAARRYSTPLLRVDDRGLIQAYLYCERERCQAIGDALLDAGGRVEDIHTQAARPLIRGWIPAVYMREAARLDGVISIGLPAYAHTR